MKFRAVEQGEGGKNHSMSCSGIDFWNAALNYVEEQMGDMLNDEYDHVVKIRVYDESGERFIGLVNIQKVETRRGYDLEIINRNTRESR